MKRAEEASYRENPNTAAARLTAVLAGLIHVQSPDLQLPDRTGMRHEPPGPLSFRHVLSTEGQVVPGAPVSIAPNTQTPPVVCTGAADYFIAYADATDGNGTGSLSAIVARRGGSNEPITDCAKLSGTCYRSTGPHGEIIVTVTESSAAGRSNAVSVSKPDGTAVTLRRQRAGLVEEREPTRPAHPAALAHPAHRDRDGSGYDALPALMVRLSHALTSGGRMAIVVRYGERIPAAQGIRRVHRDGCGR